MAELEEKEYHIVNSNSNSTKKVLKKKPVAVKKEAKEKKTKSKNWKPEETAWLVDAVSRKRDIIESKATNRGFRELNMKNTAWCEIEKAYNNKVNFTQRSIESIKAKWDNLKTECKKKADALKKHLNQTGAAPDSKLALSPQEERVMAVMNAVKNSLTNPFDDDAGNASISYSCGPAPAGNENDSDNIAQDEQDVPTVRNIQ